MCGSLFLLGVQTFFETGGCGDGGTSRSGGEERVRVPTYVVYVYGVYAVSRFVGEDRVRAGTLLLVHPSPPFNTFGSNHRSPPPPTPSPPLPTPRPPPPIRVLVWLLGLFESVSSKGPLTEAFRPRLRSSRNESSSSQTRVSSKEPWTEAHAISASTKEISKFESEFPHASSKS